jgi:hypothetical protein
VPSGSLSVSDKGHLQVTPDAGAAVPRDRREGMASYPFTLFLTAAPHLTPPG